MSGPCDRPDMGGGQKNGMPLNEREMQIDGSIIG